MEVVTEYVLRTPSLCIVRSSIFLNWSNCLNCQPHRFNGACDPSMSIRCIALVDWWKLLVLLGCLITRPGAGAFLTAGG